MSPEPTDQNNYFKVQNCEKNYSVLNIHRQVVPIASTQFLIFGTKGQDVLVPKIWHREQQQSRFCRVHSMSDKIQLGEIYGLRSSNDIRHLSAFDRLTLQQLHFMYECIYISIKH